MLWNNHVNRRWQTNDVYAIVKYTILCTEGDLRKTCPSRGCWIVRSQEEGFNKDGGGNLGGLRSPSELCILPILNFLTDIKIKYNENIVGYIISHKNHLNSQIFCAKNVLLEICYTVPPWFENSPLGLKSSWKYNFYSFLIARFSEF